MILYRDGIMCEWIRGGKVSSGARLVVICPLCLYSLHVFLSYMCGERHATSYMHMVIYMCCSHYFPIDNLLTKLY